MAVIVTVAVGVAVSVAVTVVVAVEVAVGVGGMPNAVPDNFTVWGLPAASSVIVSVPVSLVCLGLLASTGLKVTDTMQVAGLAASAGMQLSTTI